VYAGFVSEVPLREGTGLHRELSQTVSSEASGRLKGGDFLRAVFFLPHPLTPPRRGIEAAPT